MVASHGLLHVNLNVSDLERSVRFYCEGLGFELVTRSTEEVERGFGSETVRQAVLTVPGSRTILALTHSPSLEVGPKGLNHLGLVLDSDQTVPAVLGLIELLGGSVQKHGTREFAGHSERFAYIRDPDGYAIELSTQAILYSRFPS